MATKFMYQQRWLDPADQEFYGHYLDCFREGPAPWAEVAGSAGEPHCPGRRLARKPARDRPHVQVSDGAFEKLASEIRRTMKLVIDGIDDMPGGEEAVQRHLRRSLSDLRDVLTRLPADRLTEAELVAEQAKV